MGVVRFSVPGALPSKSNYRFSPHSSASRDRWKRIKSYENDIGWAAVAAGAKANPPRPFTLRMVLCSQRCDPDNAAKVALDGLKGVAVADDAGRWLKRLDIHWAEQKTVEPFVLYEIRYLEPA